MSRKDEITRRDKTQPLKGRRPFPLTVIMGVYLLWILLGWLRFTAALRGKDLIMDLVQQSLELYLIAAGLLWGLAGLPVICGMLTRADWTPVLIRITALIYPGIYWFERLFLWQDTDASRNWPFMLLLTILWLLLTFGALQLTRVQKYFEKQ